MSQTKITAIILSGGKGTRLNSDIPKQYIRVRDRAIISYSLEIFLNHQDIDSVVIVAADEWHQFILDEMKENSALNDKFIGFARPGDNRQLSIWNALEVINNRFANEDNVPSDCDRLVMIHDAARPCISNDLITRLIVAYKGYDGVIPVLPMKNTLYMSENGQCITALLDRDKIYAGHTPELFNLKKYYKANKALLPDRIKLINGSSEPAVMGGMNIAMIENDENNFKITTNADLERFKLQDRKTI